MYAFNIYRMPPMDYSHYPIYKYPNFLFPAKFFQPILSKPNPSTTQTPNIIEETPVQEIQPQIEKSINTESLKKKSMEEKLDYILASTRSSMKKCIKKQKLTIKGKSRKRKSYDQIEVLKKLLNTEEKINNEAIEMTASKIGLKTSQVYKWLWDHRKYK